MGRLRVGLSIAAAGILPISLLPAVISPVFASPAPLTALDWSLTARPSGLPSGTSTAAQQFQSADLRLDFLTHKITGKVVLRGTPTAGTDAKLQLRFGTVSGTTCVHHSAATEVLSSTYEGSDFFQRSGRTITVDVPATYEQDKSTWGCAVAVLAPTGSGSDHDALIGTTRRSYTSPRLSVSRIGSLKLVRDVWTTVHVTVKNDGPVGATGVRLSGRGSGIKVKSVSLGGLAKGRRADVRVQVKLTSRSKKKRTLTLTAAGSGARADRAVRVRPASAPKKPAAGKYRSRDGAIEFRINRKRQVTGWHTRKNVQTRCGGYPDSYYYTSNRYSHPKTKVARNGLVDSVNKRSNYTTQLRLKATGKKVTGGYFSYYGPDGCSVTLRFSAKRIGR